MKNEKGYALPTVLLIMVIFTVVALAFFGQALNSTKQNEKIETQSQSVALSEMGIDYFYQEVGNSYTKNQPIVEAKIAKMIDDDREKDDLQSPEFYEQKAKELMIELLKGDLNGGNKEVGPSSSYIIQFNENDVSDLGDAIGITYTSIGKEGEETSTLGANLNIHLKGTGIGDSSGDLTEISMPDFNSIKKPENISRECINPTGNNQVKNCSEILVTNGKSDGDYRNKGNNKDNLIIYSTTNLDLKNANKMEDMKLHINGDLSTGNLNNTKKTFIEVTGNADLDGKVDLDDLSKIHVKGNLTAKEVEMDRSKIVVGGAMTVDKELDIEEKSQLIVGGSLMARDEVDVDEKSSLIVKGALMVSKDLEVEDSSFVIIYGSAHIVGKLEIDKGCKVCVAGSLAYGKLENKGKLFVQGDSQELFEKNCGLGGNNPANWNDEIGRTIEYNSGK